MNKREASESVGHTARFVLDYVPCDILPLRKMEGSLSREKIL
jgi:hypothetical protein